MANVTLRNVRRPIRRLRGHQGRRRSRSATASSACWSAPPAAASPRCCAWSRGSRPITSRRDRHRRPRRQPDRARRPRHRDGVPELRALSAYERLQQHGLWPAQPRHGQGRDRYPRARKPRAFSSSRAMLDRKPRQLSGGQRQRVAMGRAIVRQPKVFLFDEPLSNLDAKLRIAMRVEIRKLQRRLNTTSIYVTHDQLEAMTLADILVVMNGGQVEQIGNPLEIYQKPATTFVAAFIGAPPMNLMLDAHPISSNRLAGSDGRHPRHPSRGSRDRRRRHARRRRRASTSRWRRSSASARRPSSTACARAAGRCGPRVSVETRRTAAGRNHGPRFPARTRPAIGEKIRAWRPREKLHLFTADGRKRIDS